MILTTSIFQQLGGLSAVKQLADEFYDVMDSEADYAELRALHPTKLHSTKKKLYLLLAHWLGGPELLTVNPPSAELLELRHRRVELTESLSEMWLACMNTAMTNLAITPEIKQQLNHKFVGMISAMKHQRKKVLATKNV